MRVYLISTVALHREGLAEVLALREGIEVVGVTAEPIAAAAAVADGCTIVVLDMTGLDPAIVAPRVARTTGAQVVAINVSAQESDVIACAEAGIACCLTAEASLEQLVAAIRSVSRGEAPCSPRTGAILLRRVALLAQERRTPADAPTGAMPRLTKRELEIIELVDRGFSNKEIARELCIELPTVKNHMHRILDKLGVRRRAEAAALVHGDAARRSVRSTSPSPVR